MLMGGSIPDAWSNAPVGAGDLEVFRNGGGKA